jgi:hypothetical protein
LRVVGNVGVARSPRMLAGRHWAAVTLESVACVRSTKVDVEDDLVVVEVGIKVAGALEVGSGHSELFHNGGLCAIGE